MKVRTIAATSALAILVGAALVHDELRAREARARQFEATTIGVPFCIPERAGPRYKTFFRLAMAQNDPARPRRSEVGPFTRVVPSAESVARADADPVLAPDLGTLRHPVRTKHPRAQRYFDQGLRLSYAFNHGEALRAFRKARSLDPGCAMCFWGEALVMGPNVNAPMEATLVPAAWEAVRKAAALAEGPGADPKERALVTALGARYSDDPRADRATLDAAYAQAMQGVAAAYPADDDIQVLAAEALMDLQPWDYWDGGGERPKGRTAEIMARLETVLGRTPGHPGAIHLYIHMTEASGEPARALPFARRLGAAMPGAGHLVHMPFHTFFRLGLYREALDANRRAVEADERYIERSAPVGIYPQAYYPHNVHSLMVSAQMAGDGATVIAAASKLGGIVTDAAARGIAWVQPIKAAPYFAHAQFGDSGSIAALPDPGPEFSYVRAMWHYARGVAFASAGDAPRARAELAAIETLERTGDFADLTAGGVPAREILQIAQHVVKARLALGAGEAGAAVESFRAAVAVEDTLAYSEPPYWYYPIRQSLAAALLLSGRADEAAETFRASLARVPNNGWALFGLQQAYARLGRTADADAAGALLARAWVGDRSRLRLGHL